MRLVPRSTALRYVAAALALLLALQSMLSSAWAATGHLHRHVQTTSSMRLSDFRRDNVALLPVVAVMHTGAQRHHHGTGMAGVVRKAEDRAADRAIDHDSATGDAAALFFALLPVMPDGRGGASRSPQIDGARWTATAHAPSLPERPPRA